MIRTWKGQLPMNGPAYYKNARTFYSEDKIANARKNINRYAWAKEIGQQTVEMADTYLEYGCDYLWDLVTTQALPRSYGVNQVLGCPICKKGIDRFGYPALGGRS
ncbi:hypothetical protein [Paenibacillus sp. MBLB4367]|uniref:hypothetical protein n=1 Tax=Paenibacillus sp. MBLB4367 TaxID=3384767 RepID=UPI00390809CE